METKAEGVAASAKKKKSEIEKNIMKRNAFHFLYLNTFVLVDHT